MGRGSTLPGKIALTFDKNILQNLANNYEVVVIAGNQRKDTNHSFDSGHSKGSIRKLC